MVARHASQKFDPQNPPMDPPTGCVNRLMWQLARRMFADHQAGLDGYCQVCRPFQFYPCVGRQLADIGLVSAYRQPNGAPWRLHATDPVVTPGFNSRHG